MNTLQGICKRQKRKEVLKVPEVRGIPTSAEQKSPCSSVIGTLEESSTFIGNTPVILESYSHRYIRITYEWLNYHCLDLQMREALGYDLFQRFQRVHTPTNCGQAGQASS
jgi:hypothetical protein